MTFDGKTALMTGALAGLRHQLARFLLESSVREILAASRVNALNNPAAEPGYPKAIPTDMSDEQVLKICFSELGKNGKKSDICVNNARIAALTLVFQEDDSQNFESIIQTSLMSV